ncbi:MAG: RtcB family protein [Eggerthellaceae bacterium]|nr:RtcB family protein [Eggerthellaceae bacterium]
MIEITGKHNTARCFTPNLEDKAAQQIKAVCDQEEFSGCTIRIMPDVHAGMGCTIGTTMTITDKIVPGMVGVDIGCGMETVRVEGTSNGAGGGAGGLDFARLDACIHKLIPAGFEIRHAPHKLADEIDLSELRCAKHMNLDRAYRSIGTLGGGNHFIEVDGDGAGGLYLVVHSGSRHLGCEVADYYQAEGYHALCGSAKHQIDDMIAQLKAEGREREIASRVKGLRSQTEIPVPKDLAYVEGPLFDDYLHDMKIVQHFAVLNRKAMAEVMLVGMRLSVEDEFTTIHNYIDTDAMILRKGSVSAKAGEKLLIPINMRDGSLICTGLGNPDWNFSAPHGAGRLMSRSAAFKQLSMAEYQAEMSGVYSTCVLPDTLDESPMAYKPMDEIVEQIAQTAEVVTRIKPLYNFKAAENARRRK